MQNTVACTAAAMQYANIQRPFLGNGSLNTLPREKNKHVNNIRATVRKPHTTEIMGAVFSVGSAPGLYNEDPRPAHYFALLNKKKSGRGSQGA
jgi:hypothetical protein